MPFPAYGRLSFQQRRVRYFYQALSPRRVVTEPSGLRPIFVEPKFTVAS
jgi:hypothetical protein